MSFLRRLTAPIGGPVVGRAVNYCYSAMMGMALLYISLMATSVPVTSEQREAIDRAIRVLEYKGFEREAFLLRGTAQFRGSDHWLNGLVFKENAYAATNFPFQIITVYPDFYSKATDDTERAMILLHEAQHLQQKDEPEAYAYVWENRRRLGWTQLSHGTTATYTDVAAATREIAPLLFTCPNRLWNDCTEAAK